ncbi:cyclic nucleotide-binding domain-containing protein [Azospirillum doebereinerae]|uniref:Cyclic nucleotide-binding domain-containing protein n=1 Tax=Azospirillum doebereinerae TaxID=92933 RepID=A0A3S0V2T4_9PROT|nr:cyclic nucleotide-binding domain-containing protein [Azospirillum doebereinerae]MCG5244269.1 cyclic nucleotide-binding domain-containing protein [Azospirillum doebereinerae]RUQ62056.1 cyclic nucleotide-binding domain-containing protein [Azospirillum doebereinerae]
MRKVLYILGNLSDEDIEWMARTGRRLDVGDGHVLVRQGQPADCLYIVLEGHASVDVAGVGVVARLGSGEVIGEVSFVDSAPPSATVSADGRCVALALNRRDIEARLRGDGAFAGRFYKALAIFLADRLRGTVDRLKHRPGQAMAADRIMEDELDEGLLDQVSLAGVRFDRMLRTLLGAAA